MSRTFDHASILRTIEARWGLDPLTPRDASTNDLSDALDFSNPDFDAPVYDVPARVPVPCPAVSPGTGMAPAMVAPRRSLPASFR